jgi:hypothetical protein
MWEPRRLTTLWASTACTVYPSDCLITRGSKHARATYTTLVQQVVRSSTDEGTTAQIRTMKTENENEREEDEEKNVKKEDEGKKRKRN